MRRILFVLVAVISLAGVIAYMAPASGQADRGGAPIFGVKIPPGYRDWRLISVAHEEGNLNDLRAILGNDVAIKASREGLSLNLLIGLSRSPNEWAWSYIMMASFALLFLSTHAGRVFGLDGWLARRIEPAARAGHTWWGRAWMLMT